MTNYIPVLGNSNLVRDGSSNAIINVNNEEYNSYVKQKSIKEVESMTIEKIQCDIDSLKCDLNEIKCLLKEMAKWKVMKKFL